MHIDTREPEQVTETKSVKANNNENPETYRLKIGLLNDGRNP